MTPQQVQVVKNSWKIFQDINPVLVGEVFYGKLFMSYPRLKPMFTLPIELQSKKLVEMLSIIVGRLDRPQEMLNEVRQLSIRHISYGVKPEHYKAVGEALLWTLKKGLGKDWTDEVEEGWSNCYKMLAETMIEAAYE